MNILQLFKKKPKNRKPDFKFTDSIIIDNKKDTLDLLMGFDNNNKDSIFKNLADLKHIYLIGCTGSGCSNTMMQFIKSLATNASKEDVQLLFIDCAL